MSLCEDCPPDNYPTNKTRCLPCPRRKGLSVGQMVRFNHERDGGPVRRITNVAEDGMVELHDMGGVFAPHLFQVADDIADIPPQPIIDLGFDYRCDCCDNGLHAEWDFCPFCGFCQREQPSGLCLAGIASNKACRPDDLKRCTICGFVVDTQYVAEKPTTYLRPTRDSSCVS